MAVAAILLAAGESQRMGDAKALLPWGGQTLIEYQLSQLMQPPIDRVLVVLGHLAAQIRPIVDTTGAEVVINEMYERGRASSLKVGVRSLPDDTRTILVLNVDQARPHSVLQRLLEAHTSSGSMLTLPTFSGQRGHPAIIDGWLLPELRTVHERTQGLRALVERHSAIVNEVPFDSNIVLLDINTPEEYEKARNTYFQKVAP